MADENTAAKGEGEATTSTGGDNNDTTNSKGEGNANASSNSNQGTEGSTSDNANTNTDGDISYSDFKLPKDMTTEDAASTVDAVSKLAKDMKLTQEQAQTFIDREFGTVQSQADAQQDSWKAQLETWDNQIKADKEVGGDKLEESQGLVNLALKEMGNDTVNEIFKDSGLMSHPDVFKFFRKLGTLVKEDNPGKTGENAAEELDTVSIMYPNMVNK